ncbi:aromatic acid exporter family protein [Enterococcus alishanensis]
MNKFYNFLMANIHTKKITIALLVSIVLFLIFHVEDKEVLLIVCYTSIFVIQQDSYAIIKDSIHRLTGSLISGILSLLFFWITNFFHGWNNSNYYLLGIPILIFLSINLVGGFEKNKAGAMAACLTTINMLVIVKPTIESVYLLERLLATIIGGMIALAVNLTFHHLEKKYGTNT